VIGGYAVIQYAEPRYTKDLDFWISTDADNAQAVLVLATAGCGGF
jgi:hypothetical protein